jgi:transcriptional regulator GlxA family with amidase domain
MRSATHFQSPFFQGAPVVRDVRVARAIQLIERRGSDPPSLEELSAVAGVSARQLERLFVDAIGLAPLQCAMMIRLRFGHWLLTNSARPLARVAADCGFADQSHFTKCFRKQFGLTPMQARRAAAVVPAQSRKDAYALDAKSELHASGLAIWQPAQCNSQLSSSRRIPGMSAQARSN